MQHVKKRTIYSYMCRSSWNSLAIFPVPGQLRISYYANYRCSHARFTFKNAEVWPEKIVELEPTGNFLAEAKAACAASGRNKLLHIKLFAMLFGMPKFILRLLN